MATMMARSTTRSYQRPDTLDISAPAFSLVHLGHFRAWRCIGIEGSLSPDSCRVGRMQGTEALGQFQTFAIKEPNYNAFV